MTLNRATFSHAELAALPEPEQLVFVQLAHVMNDLRHIQSLLLVASHSVSTTAGAERAISIHQLVFSLRLLYGSLNEGWKLTKSCWDGLALGKMFYQRLPQDAQDAFKHLNQYFGGTNYTRNIRDSLAYHYDVELKLFRSVLADSDPGATHEIIIGQINANNFFTFAESLHNQAVASLAGTNDPQFAVQKFCREATEEILPRFVTFADAVLFEIAKGFKLKTEQIEVRAPVDPKTVPSILFTDES